MDRSGLGYTWVGVRRGQCPPGCISVRRRVAQDVHPSNACLPLTVEVASGRTVGVASGRTVGVAWVVGRQAGGDLSNIWKKNLWKLEFGHGKVAVQHLAGVVGFRCPLPYI